MEAVGMLRSKLIYKVLGVISATMFVGFAAMGIITLCIQYRSSMDLQIDNSRNLSAVITKNITNLMMKGEAREIEAYIRDVKEKGFIRDLKVFSVEGKMANVAASEVNPIIVQAISSGTTVEQVGTNKGIHILMAAIPLLNEERCKKCHDAGPKFLGGILLDTSTEEGY